MVGKITIHNLVRLAFSRKLILTGALLLLLSCSLWGQRRYRVGYKNEGYSNTTQVSLMFPSNQFNSGFGAETINGYFISDRFFGGIALGLNVYEDEIFMPVFADLRYSFLDGNTPFVFGDVGYSLTFEETKGGLVLHGGGGFKLFLTNTFALNLLIGYKTQSFSTLAVGQAGEFSQKKQVSSFTASVGVQF